MADTTLIPVEQYIEKYLPDASLIRSETLRDVLKYMYRYIAGADDPESEFNTINNILNALFGSTTIPNLEEQLGTSNFLDFLLQGTTPKGINLPNGETLANYITGETGTTNSELEIGLQEILFVRETYKSQGSNVFNAQRVYVVTKPPGRYGKPTSAEVLPLTREDFFLLSDTSLSSGGGGSGGSLLKTVENVSPDLSGNISLLKKDNTPFVGSEPEDSVTVEYLARIPNMTENTKPPIILAGITGLEKVIDFNDLLFAYLQDATRIQKAKLEYAIHGYVYNEVFTEINREDIQAGPVIIDVIAPVVRVLGLYIDGVLLEPEQYEVESPLYEAPPNSTIKIFSLPEIYLDKPKYKVTAKIGYALTDVVMLSEGDLFPVNDSDESTHVWVLGNNNINRSLVCRDLNILNNVTLIKGNQITANGKLYIAENCSFYLEDRAYYINYNEHEEDEIIGTMRAIGSVQFGKLERLQLSFRSSLLHPTTSTVRQTSPRTLYNRFTEYRNNQWELLFQSDSDDKEWGLYDGYNIRTPNNLATGQYTDFAFDLIGKHVKKTGTITSTSEWTSIGNPFTSRLKLLGKGGLFDLNPNLQLVYVWTNISTSSTNARNYSIISRLGCTGGVRPDAEGDLTYIDTTTGFLVGLMDDTTTLNIPNSAQAGYEYNRATIYNDLGYPRIIKQVKRPRNIIAFNEVVYSEKMIDADRGSYGRTGSPSYLNLGSLVEIDGNKYYGDQQPINLPIINLRSESKIGIFIVTDEVGEYRFSISETYFMDNYDIYLYNKVTEERTLMVTSETEVIINKVSGGPDVNEDYELIIIPR